MASKTNRAVGVDIGGTGIKGAIVDLEQGVLQSDRIKVPTPRGAEPKDVLKAVKELISNGQYKAILTRWGIQDGAITDPVINGATS